MIVVDLLLSQAESRIPEWGAGERLSISPLWKGEFVTTVVEPPEGGWTYAGLWNVLQQLAENNDFNAHLGRTWIAQTFYCPITAVDLAAEMAG